MFFMNCIVSHWPQDPAIGEDLLDRHLKIGERLAVGGDPLLDRLAVGVAHQGSWSM